MGRPVILSDNLINPRIYPGHTLTASSTASDKHVLFLSSGARRRELTGWFADDLNTDAYVEVVCDQLRAFNLLFIDRDHNLAGESISIHISDDGFTTYSELGPKTVPSAPVPMAALYDGEIVMTDEGALLWWTDLEYAHEVRLFVPAMGAGLRPELAGMMLGMAWSPVRAEIKPWDDGRYTLTHATMRSPLGQDAAGEVGRFRSRVLRLRADSWTEYLTSLYPIETLALGGRTMVVIPDDERAERAALARVAPGQAGWEVPSGQYLPELTLPWEEMEPALL